MTYFPFGIRAVDLSFVSAVFSTFTSFCLMDFKLFYPFIKKIFNSKPACTAFKCDIVQKCDISLSKTSMKAVNSRKIRAYTLLIKLFFNNSVFAPYLFHLINSHWHD